MTSRPVLFAALLLCAASLFVDEAAASDTLRVTVLDPYIELHTGPGRGYPIFHVVDSGDTVDVLKQRTSWFKVRTKRGKQGWVSRKQLEKTLDPAGNLLAVDDPNFGTYSDRRWEMGILGGDFDGANVISMYGSYALTANLSTEVWVSQGLGNFSDSVYASAGIVHQLFPEWRVSPFFALGTGVIRTSPKATLVETEDRTDQTAHAGFGVRAYLTRRFVLRAEYKSYVVFTSRDDNEEVTEWKAGFSFFF